MKYEENQPESKWQGRILVVLAAYRLLAFALAATMVFAFPTIFHSVIPPLILFIFVGIYSVVKILQPFRWYQKDIPSLCALAIDIAVCFFLIISTGGFYSPFLLYTLAPVLTVAMFFDIKATIGITGLSIAYVAASHLYNPFYPSRFSFPEPSYFFVYLAAVSLTAVLPYLTNINLRQRLQSQSVLQERQRLGREIHDGMAQNLSALRWQAQLLQRRLAEMGLHLDEARQIEKLAEEAHRDVRESLELLHNYSGNFLAYLRGYLEHLKQDTNIDFQLDLPPGELNMPAWVELELRHICQEALTNIRKHSQARHARVKLSLVNNHLEVSITDDGCGFDAITPHGNGNWADRHGLRVMKERADSIGGKFSVLSLPGKGTEVQVELPLNHH